MALLEPDTSQLEIFVEAMLRHVGDDGRVSPRTFYEFDVANKPSRVLPVPLKGGPRFLMEAAIDEARRAANAATPAVFAPPLAAFRLDAGDGWRAREEDVLEAPVLSVELDQNPRAALAKLEYLLGLPAEVTA